MRQIAKPAYTRNMHHSNLANKAGCTAAYQRHVEMRKYPENDFKKRVGVFDPQHAAHEREFAGHSVIKGKPPKVQQALSPRCEECRFTIVNSPDNSNIFEQACVRCQDVYDLCMRDLRSLFKVKSFAEDYEHVEIIEA